MLSPRRITVRRLVGGQSSAAPGFQQRYLRSALSSELFAANYAKRHVRSPCLLTRHVSRDVCRFRSKMRLGVSELHESKPPKQDCPCKTRHIPCSFVRAAYVLDQVIYRNSHAACIQIQARSPALLHVLLRAGSCLILGCLPARSGETGGWRRRRRHPPRCGVTLRLTTTAGHVESRYSRVAATVSEAGMEPGRLPPAVLRAAARWQRGRERCTSSPIGVRRIRSADTPLKSRLCRYSR